MYNKLYGSLSDYNRTRILNRVKKLIKADGGEVLHDGMISFHYKPYTNDQDNAELNAKIGKQKTIIKKAYKYCNSGDVLKFVLNGFYYYIQFDNNPFFPVLYQKIGIDKNYCYKGRRYMESSEELPKGQSISICYEYLYKICSNRVINELASHYYSKLVNSVINGKESSAWSEFDNVYNVKEGK